LAFATSPRDRFVMAVVLRRNRTMRLGTSSCSYCCSGPSIPPVRSCRTTLPLEFAWRRIEAVLEGVNATVHRMSRFQKPRNVLNSSVNRLFNALQLSKLGSLQQLQGSSATHTSLRMRCLRRASQAALQPTNTAECSDFAAICRTPHLSVRIADRVGRAPGR
jgi:hypothetical protein